MMLMLCHNSSIVMFNIILLEEIVANERNLKAGSIAPETGTYEELDSRGQKIKEMRIAKGEHFPATKDSQNCYRLTAQGRGQSEGKPSQHEERGRGAEGRGRSEAAEERPRDPHGRFESEGKPPHQEKGRGGQEWGPGKGHPGR